MVITFSWTLTVPDGSTAVLSEPTAIFPTFTADIPGDYIVTLTVNDGRISSQPVTQTISTNNVKPVANAGNDRLLILGRPIYLDGSQSYDPDKNDQISFSWTLTVPAGNAATLSIFVNDPSRPSFLPDMPDQYVATLVVNDGSLNSDPDTDIIDVKTKPIAIAGPDQFVVPGSKITVSGYQSYDPDGDMITSYRWLLYKPFGSTATLSTSDKVTTSFIPDIKGYYNSLILWSGRKAGAITDYAPKKYFYCLFVTFL